MYQLPKTCVYEYLNTDLSLKKDFVNARLNPATRDSIRKEAVDKLTKIDPIAKHIYDVKIVTNPRKNFINIRVKAEYSTLLFHSFYNGIYYCFFLSDKLEPFVIVTALDPVDGRLVKLNAYQVTDMDKAVTDFRTKYGIANETYHYTSLRERQETDKFSGATSDTKSHSSHWHIKIRIATAMYKKCFPVLNIIDFEKQRKEIEPIRYGYERECITYEQLLTILNLELAL